MVLRVFLLKEIHREFVFINFLVRVRRNSALRREHREGLVRFVLVESVSVLRLNVLPSLLVRILIVVRLFKLFVRSVVEGSDLLKVAKSGQKWRITRPPSRRSRSSRTSPS